MIRISRNRWLLVTLVHYITLFFFGQLNFYLAPIGIQIFATGMLISFSALELNYKHGLLSLIPIGLHLDSKSPLPFGSICFVILALFTVAHFLRSSVRREMASSSLFASLALTIGAFIGVTVFALAGPDGITLRFGPLFLNLLSSLLVVLLCNRLFHDTQCGILATFGINLAEEQRQAR